MNTIVIPTTQNIELEYPIAEASDRVFAFGIDFIIQLAYTLVVIYGSDELGIKLSSAGYVLLLLPVFTYTFFSEVFMHGQTLGKKLRNLKVIRQDGSSPGIGEYFLRWLFRLVDIWVVFFVPGVVGFITMSSNQRGQRLGDLAAGTTLIKNELVTGFDDTIFRALDEGYVMRFPQIETLSDKDVAILKEVLDIGLKNQDPEILHRLANKIKEVAEIKSKLLDSDFLEIVLQDYNYLYGQD